MNTAKWITHFERNKLNRTEPDWSAPVQVPPGDIRLLNRTLAQFQLGDGGGPACLIAGNAAKFRNQSEDMRRVVDLWFEEEKEHSRLLGCALKRFGGTPITSHWSFTAFCLSRQLLGVRFELTVLLLTEIVSTAYYRLLRRHAGDPAIDGVCALILRDEAGHVAFHRDRLAHESGARGWLWRLRFQLLGHAAAMMLWANHGPCLKPLGATTSEFYHEVRLELTRFIARLDRRVAWLKSALCDPRRKIRSHSPHNRYGWSVGTGCQGGDR